MFLVSIEDTIKGFHMILDGELDQYPEAAFNLKGNIDEVIEAGREDARRKRCLMKVEILTPDAVLV